MLAWALEDKQDAFNGKVTNGEVTNGEVTNGEVTVMQLIGG